MPEEGKPSPDAHSVQPGADALPPTNAAAKAATAPEAIEAGIVAIAGDQARAESEEKRVRAQFASKYGAVAGRLLTSRWRIVRDLATNALSLYEMLVDPDYTLPWEAKASVVFALSYFISPVDAIPDLIPGLGYADDAMVVAYVLHRVAGEIARYRAWRKQQGRPLPDP